MNKLINVHVGAINYPAFLHNILNKKTLQIKKCQRRFYRISFISLGKGDKFFKIEKVTSNVLLHGVKKEVKKDIPIDTKGSINHYFGQIKGWFQFNENGDKFKGMVALTRSQKYNVTKKGKIEVKTSIKLDENQSLSTEIRLVDQNDLNENKLYSKENKIVSQYSNKMENKLNEIYDLNGQKFDFIEGLKNNELKSGKFTKLEKDNKTTYLIQKLDQ